MSCRVSIGLEKRSNGEANGTKAQVMKRTRMELLEGSAEFVSVGKDAFKKWGYQRQADHLQEECAELIAEISHLRRNRSGARDKVLEEITDVRIMVEEVMNEFSSEERNGMMRKKLDNTIAKLEG